jgi:tetratricopeptide (TPR) repeat protein
MVANELTRKDSTIVLEMNQIYRTAQAAQEKGQYEAASKIYKDIIQATDMMFQEAAQFVRKHIAFEEKLFNAYQRAQEYYDKGEYWMARKLWEKIVEEAERSMLK